MVLYFIIDFLYLLYFLLFLKKTLFQINTFIHFQQCIRHILYTILVPVSSALPSFLIILHSKILFADCSNFTVTTILQYSGLYYFAKELVAEIDKDAKANYRTRSQQINMILTEYYKTQMTTKHESE